MFGNIFNCHNLGVGMLLASSEQRSKMLLNILPWTRQLPKIQNNLAQNVNSAKAEKPCSIPRSCFGELPVVSSFNTDKYIIQTENTTVSFVLQLGVHSDAYQKAHTLISPPSPAYVSDATCFHSWLEIEKASVITKSFN